MAVFTYIQNLGSSIVVPIIIIILALIFRMGVLKSIRAGVTFAIGYIGLNLVITMMFQYLGPVTDILIKKFNLHLTNIDAGWSAAASVSFATTIGAFIIPFILIINLVLLFTKLTSTMNIDIWNYWHYAFTGAVVFILTQNIVYGFIAAGIQAVISLKLADLSAPYIEKTIGTPGISVPQGFAVSTVPVFLLLDKLYDRIPGFNKIKADSETINKRLGVMGEPLMIGLVLGVLLGVVCGYSFKDTVTLALSMAAVMLLLPRMVKLIMEGLIPLSDGAKTFLQKHVKGADFYIGLDSAIMIGHPTTLAVSIFLIPITLVLAAVLPGNTVLPFADLASTAYFVCMATPIHKGNFLRTLISGIIMMGIVLLLASYFSPFITTSALSTGFKFPNGATAITALSAGNLIAFVISLFLRFKVIGTIVACTLTGLFLFGCRRYEIKKAQKEAA